MQSACIIYDDAYTQNVDVILKPVFFFFTQVTVVVWESNVQQKIWKGALI